MWISCQTKYSVNRHIQRKHIEVEKPVLPIENEMHVVHKDSKRCYTSKTFECPNCQTFFESAKNLNDHMKEKHEEPSSLSLMSDNSSDSWMFGVKCKECEQQFQNEADLEVHMKSTHVRLQVKKKNHSKFRKC